MPNNIIIRLFTAKYFLLRVDICHLLFLFPLLLISTYSHAVEKKPALEEDFFTKTIDQILPGKVFNQKATSPLDSFEIFQKKSNELVIWMTFWQYQTFRYPLFVQVFNNTVQDLYLTFPSFFLHDQIHKILVTRWGTQNFYKRANLSAIYRWNKLENLDATAVYEANCSITCFPVSLAIHNNKLDKSVTPLWQQFHELGISKKIKK